MISHRVEKNRIAHGCLWWSASEDMNRWTLDMSSMWRSHCEPSLTYPMTTHDPHGSRYDLVTRHESANLPQGAAGMMDELNNGLYFRLVLVLEDKIVNSCQHLSSFKVVDVQMMWHKRMKKYWTRWHCLLCRSGARLIDYVLVWEEKSEVKRDICFPWEKSFENRKKGDCIFFQDSTNLDHSDKRATYITKVWLCRNYVIC